MRASRNHPSSSGSRAGELGIASPSDAGRATPGHQRTERPRRLETPPPVAGYIQSLLSALIGLWVIAALVSFFADVGPLYTLSALGLLFSVQATYYKHKLSVDPGYAIQGCKCGRAAADRTEAVLGSEASEFMGVPSSAIGAVAYAALLFLVHEGQQGWALMVASLALLASAYLAYLMVIRIRALCSLCISTCAVNVWLVWYLVR